MYTFILYKYLSQGFYKKKNVLYKVTTYSLIQNMFFANFAVLFYVYFSIIQWRQSNYKFIKTQKDMLQFLVIEKLTTFLFVQQVCLFYENITHRCHLRSHYKM